MVHACIMPMKIVFERSLHFVTSAQIIALESKAVYLISDMWNVCMCVWLTDFSYLSLFRLGCSTWRLLVFCRQRCFSRLRWRIRQAWLCLMRGVFQEPEATWNTCHEELLQNVSGASVSGLRQRRPKKFGKPQLSNVFIGCLFVPMCLITTDC